MIVQIPNSIHHNGDVHRLVKREIDAVCPLCGGPRGRVVYQQWHYDNGRRLLADWWDNPCGHKEDYAALIHNSVPVPADVPTDFELTLSKAITEQKLLKQHL